MVNIAIAGPGRISRRFLQGTGETEHARVTAFATRNPERVKEYAAEFGITKMDSFSALCADPLIDAFYIATPNEVHVPMIREALENGKHVICEKPITIMHTELKELFDLAHEKHLVLMEAHKTLYTPTFQSIYNLVRSGTLGEIYSASASFCRRGQFSEEEWRLRGQGAGAAYDVGCYGLCALAALFSTDLRVVESRSVLFGDTDGEGFYKLEADGIPLRVNYSFLNDGDCDLVIHGEQGTLTCTQFWKSDRYLIVNPSGTNEYVFPFNNEFAFEAEQFAKRIEAGQYEDPFSEGVSLCVMEVLDGTRGE